MASRIIARRTLTKAYLLDIGNGKGFVADLEAGLRFPPTDVAAILKHGYWESCENDPQLLADLLQLKEAK